MDWTAYSTLDKMKVSEMTPEQLEYYKELSHKMEYLCNLDGID